VQPQEDPFHLLGHGSLKAYIPSCRPQSARSFPDTCQISARGGAMFRSAQRLPPPPRDRAISKAGFVAVAHFPWSFSAPVRKFLYVFLPFISSVFWSNAFCLMGLFLPAPLSKSALRCSCTRPAGRSQSTSGFNPAKKKGFHSGRDEWCLLGVRYASIVAAIPFPAQPKSHSAGATFYILLGPRCPQRERAF